MSTSSLSTKSSEESILEAEAIVQVEGEVEGEVEGGVEGGQEWRWRMCVQLKRADILVTQRKEF